MYVTGTSKLQSEAEYAWSIPESERQLINKSFLNIKPKHGQKDHFLIADYP